MERHEQQLLNIDMKRFRNVANQEYQQDVSTIMKHLYKYERFIIKIKYNGKYENEYLIRSFLSETEIYFLWECFSNTMDASFLTPSQTMLEFFVDWLLKDCEDKSLELFIPEILKSKVVNDER